MVEGAAGHIYSAANNHVSGYIALTVGSANLITSFGSQDQIDTYVPKMMSAEWMGTMCLTEPEAGSALGNLSTKASLTDDGHYDIKGQKVFISGGDHQFADNFIHMVLARIDGAPKGSRGISLFIVPKFRLKDDGSLEPNDVLTAGDYQKMGQRGYCTAHLMFGENDNCRGWLVGEPNKGLKYMFQMMNQARLEVGITATSVAMSAYYHSLQYSKERKQGKRLNDTGERVTEQTEIINHADVRRMLLMQKSVAVGSLSLLMESFKLYDLVGSTEGDEKNDYFLLLDLLTPIAKAYPSEYGELATSNGIQVLGGYGFTVDFPQEQFLRDLRITSIYEGTTAIQGMDLLGRKFTAQNGKALMILMAKMNETIEEAKKSEELMKYAIDLENGIKIVQKTLEYLLPFAFTKKYESYLKDATLFLELISHVVISWQWLKMGIDSVTGSKYKEDFYKGNILTMKYYFNYELPKISSLSDTIINSEDVTIADGNDWIN
jgi:butyryl-CoA dehydrogenase